MWSIRCSATGLLLPASELGADPWPLPSAPLLPGIPPAPCHHLTVPHNSGEGRAVGEAQPGQGLCCAEGTSHQLGLFVHGFRKRPPGPAASPPTQSVLTWPLARARALPGWPGSASRSKRRRRVLRMMSCSMMSAPQNQGTAYSRVMRPMKSKSNWE